MNTLDLFGAAAATHPAAGAWSWLSTTVFSAEVIRPVILASILGGWAAFRRLLKDRVSSREWREQMTRDFRELTEHVTRVDHELHPNSGGSLRDAVDNIAAEVGHQGRRLDAHLDWADDQLDRLDRGRHRGPQIESPGSDV